MNPISSHLLDVHVTKTADHLEFTYSKSLSADQRSHLSEKLTAIYEQIWNRISKKDRKDVQEMDFTFDEGRNLQVNILKTDKTTVNVDIEDMAGKVEQIKVLEDELLDIVDDFGKKILKPKKLLDVYVHKQGDRFDVLCSQHLSKVQTTIVSEKITQLYMAVLPHLSEEMQANIEEIDFAFSEGKDLKIIVTTKDHKNTIYDSKELLADESEGIKQIDNELATFVDQIRQEKLKGVVAPRNALQKFIYSIRKAFALSTSIKPTIQSITHDLISKQLTEDQLKQLYIDPSALFHTIKGKILVDNPHFQDLVDEKDVKSLIQKELVQEIQKRMIEIHKGNKKKLISDIQTKISELNAKLRDGPVENSSTTMKELQSQLIAATQSTPILWDEGTTQKLDMQRVIHYLKTHTREPQPQLFELLRNLPAKDIPLKEVALINVTTSNQDDLAQLWKHLARTFFEKGKLDKLASVENIGEVSQQADDAISFLNTLSHIPRQLKGVIVNPPAQSLENFCNSICTRKSMESIKDFVIQKMQREFELDDPSLRRARITYQKCIESVFTEMNIDKLSILDVVDKLTLKDRSFSTAFVANVRLKERQLKRSSTYSDERLLTILQNHLEKLAVTKYRLIPVQLSNVRQARTEFENQAKQEVEIRAQMDKNVEGRKKIKVMEETLTAKQASLAHSSLELPAYDLPVARASKAERDVAIQEYLNGLEETLTGLQTEQTNLNQRVKVDIPKQLKAKGSPKKKAELKQERTAAEKRLVEITAQLKETQKLLTVRGSHDVAQMERLVSKLKSIPIPSREVNINELDESSLTTFTEAIEGVRSDLAAINAKLSGKKHSKEDVSQQKILTTRLVAMETALHRIESFKQDQAEVPRLEEEINTQTQALNKDLADWFKTYIKDNDVLSALGTMSSGAASRRFLTSQETDSLSVMWELAIQHTLSSAQLDQLPADAPIEDFQNQLKDYVRLKSYVEHGAMSQSIYKRVKEEMTKIEKAFPEELRIFVNEAAEKYQMDANEILYADNVLEAISQGDKGHYSTINAAQQANLMFLNKMFNKVAIDPKKITSAEKIKLQQVLKTIRDDKPFREQIDRYHGINANKTSDVFLDYVPGFAHGFVKRFIAKDLNKKVGPKPVIEGGITPRTLKFLKSFYAKTKNLKELDQVAAINAKSRALLTKMKDPEQASKIAPSERLTLAELGMLSRSERLDEKKKNQIGLVEELTELGVTENDPIISKWVKNYKDSAEILKEMDELVRPEINTHYEDGCILAHATKRREAWMGRKASMDERVIAYVSGGYTHGAKLYHNAQSEITISHVIGDYTQESLSLYELCTSEIWSIDVVPLIDPAIQQQLQEIYGADWQKEVNKLYQNIEKRLHTEGAKRFDKIENDTERRMKAGLANRPWLYRMLGRRDIKGHERTLKRDFNKIHKKFFEGELSDKQICSEFVSKSTLASMVELNKQLTQKMMEHAGAVVDGKLVLKELTDQLITVPENVAKYLKGEPFYHKNGAGSKAGEKLLRAQGAKEFEKAQKDLKKILKSQGWEETDIKLLISVRNEEILKVPYQKERMRGIHPGRMSEILEKQGCAQRKLPPTKLAQMVDLSIADKTMKLSLRQVLSKS